MKKSRFHAASPQNETTRKPGAMRSWMSYGGAYPLLSNRSVAIQTISLLLVFLAPLLGVRGSVAGAQDTAQALVTPETRRAVDRGLEFLLDRQFPDGSLSRDSRDGNAHPGISALAGMALLASGSTPVRGPYRGAVNRITGYLLKVCDRRTGIIADTLTQGEPMYAHTFATLYLAEVCGEDPRPEVRAAVKRAVDLILRAQRPGGGWRYRVQGRDADVSVTACALMALRGARAAGIRVPPRAVRRALQYVLSCAKPDGSFQYQAEGGHASFQLTAAALTARFAVGCVDGVFDRSEASGEQSGADNKGRARMVRGSFHRQPRWVSPAPCSMGACHTGKTPHSTARAAA